MSKALLIIAIMITDPAAHTQVVEYPSMEQCRVAMNRMADVHIQALVNRAPNYYDTDRIRQLTVRQKNGAFIRVGVLNVSLTCSDAGRD